MVLNSMADMLTEYVDRLLFSAGHDEEDDIEIEKYDLYDDYSPAPKKGVEEDIFDEPAESREGKAQNMLYAYEFMIRESAVEAPPAPVTVVDAPRRHWQQVVAPPAQVEVTAPALPPPKETKAKKAKSNKKAKKASHLPRALALNKASTPAAPAASTSPAKPKSNRLARKQSSRAAPVSVRV